MQGNITAEAIGKLMASFCQKWSEGDIEGACRIYAPEAMDCHIDSQVCYRGREAIIRRCQEAYPSREAMGELSLEMLGDIRFFDGRTAAALWQFTLRAQGETRRGLVEIYYRQHGEDVRVVIEIAIPTEEEP